MYLRRSALVFIVIWLAFSAVFAQKRRTVIAVGGYRSQLVNSDGRSQVYALDSKILGRKVWFGVLLPEGYHESASRGRVYPVVYLLHGLSGHFENWFAKTAVKTYADGYDVIVVTPEGGDGWYTDSATVPNDKYESHILQDVIPEIDNRFRTMADRRGRAVAGLSMGGYGAIKFGLKRPDLFSVVGSFSGALNAPLMTKNSPIFYQSIPVVFGPEGSKTRAENDIFALLRAVSAERIAGLPFIYLDCGTEDPFLATNREFDQLLLEKKVRHEFRQLPGKHSWDYWDRQVKEFFQVAARHDDLFAMNER